ncbi:MAG TPA: DUF1415 domain-containing protein [Steroidobacteraceae bacterium]|nr:DUF1415 domain-containing protein [Steroidobacteraceae bacterium]
MNPSREQVLAETRAWVDRAVIGLNLCPFARGVQTRNQVSYVVSAAQDVTALLADLGHEMDRLLATDAAILDTTLLIHPLVLNDFLDFNDFLGAADELLEQLGYEGILQVASFHPQFQFAGTQSADVTNATNWSPYPILHLLREDSVERAVAALPDAESIYEQNMRTLERLGAAGVAALQAQCKLP